MGMKMLLRRAAQYIANDVRLHRSGHLVVSSLLAFSLLLPISCTSQLRTPVAAANPAYCFDFPGIAYSFGDTLNTRADAHTWIVLDSALRAPQSDTIYTARFAETLPDSDTRTWEGSWSPKGDSITIWWHDVFTTSRYVVAVTDTSISGVAGGGSDYRPPDNPSGAWSRGFWARRIECPAVAYGAV